MELVQVSSIEIDQGGLSEAVAISTTSAQSKAIKGRTALVSVTADCYVRSGANPTALGTGVDLFIFGGNALRFTGIEPGHKLAFITLTGTGTAYITPEA